MASGFQPNQHFGQAACKLMDVLHKKSQTIGSALDRKSVFENSSALTHDTAIVFAFSDVNTNINHNVLLVKY
jgi:S-adenosylmethionine synthetase